MADMEQTTTPDAASNGPEMLQLADGYPEGTRGWVIEDEQEAASGVGLTPEEGRRIWDELYGPNGVRDPG